MTNEAVRWVVRPRFIIVSLHDICHQREWRQSLFLYQPIRKIRWENRGILWSLLKLRLENWCLWGRSNFNIKISLRIKHTARNQDVMKYIKFHFPSIFEINFRKLLVYEISSWGFFHFDSVSSLFCFNVSCLDYLILLPQSKNFHSF